MKTIREDVNGKDVDDVARKVIDSTQYKGRFIHSLGPKPTIVLNEGPEAPAFIIS